MDDKVIVDLLGQVGKLFTSSLELKENIDFMLKATHDLVACDAATLFLADPSDQSLSAIATYPFTEKLGSVARFARGEGIVGWAVKARRVVSVPDATKDQRFKSLDLAYAPRSCLVMPLESPRHTVGALTVARRQVQPFTQVEQALVQILANQAAISIDNASLYAAQKNQLAEIATQKRDLELANDVLDLSKIEAGRMELSYESFQVGSAFREVHNVIRSLSERRNLELGMDIVPRELEVRADKSKFKQVMYNLLSNAIKFTDPGGKVWVRARSADGELVVEVGDTGVGIAPEHQELVFTEFFQVDTPTTRQAQGTGLGLALTRRLVQLHGGFIGVESSRGHGSVFTVRMPLGGLQ